MKLHCPVCGTLLKDFIVITCDSMSTWYDTYCETCNKIVSVEDRRAYEQEGITEIILR